MRVVFVAALASLLVACSSSSSPSSCVPGASVSCSCANGKTGAQVCASDGTLGACSCDTGTGTGGSGSGTGGATGSGGATGTGGSPGHGGAVGTGGATSSGGATGTGGTTGTGGSTAMSASGQFTVTFDGTLTKTYSTCYACAANYYATPPPIEGALAFDYNTGQSAVDVDARPASSGSGYEVSVGVEDTEPSTPAGIQGTYLSTPTWVPMTGSCVTFSQFSLQHGGGMAGTLNCTLTGGNDTTPHTAVVQGSFQGTFAP
jgi:hypothetical protein